MICSRVALRSSRVAAVESAELSRSNSAPKARPSHLGSVQAASRPNDSPPRSQRKDDQSLRSKPLYASRRHQSSSPKPPSSRSDAGVGRVASYEEVDGALFDETLAVNLRAPYLLARHVLPGMRERGFDRIVFISSVAAFIGGIVGPHYAASKAALHGLTHYFAPRVAPDGVTVNAIAPALIEDTGIALGDPQQLAARIPVGRLGTPAEVADLTVAVLRNGYITNQVFSIDGGVYPR